MKKYIESAMKKNILTKKDSTYDEESNNIIMENEDQNEEIQKFLNSYVVPSIEEEKILETVDMLRKYMPKSKKQSSLIMMIKNEITYINKLYILISIGLVLMGLFLPSKDYETYYLYLLIISPILFLIGLFEIVKGREEKMWELEKSFKYNCKQIILSRLVIISSFSIILNLILCGIFSVNASFIVAVKLMLNWIAPFSIAASISLLIVSKVESNVSVMFCICSWIAAAFMAQNLLLKFMESVNLISLISAIAISISIFIYSIYTFYKKTIDFEGMITWN